MRITLVQGAFLPVPPLLGGAVEKVWYALGRAFAAAGHTVTHVSRAYPGLPDDAEVEGVRERRVPGFAAPRALWRLKLRDLRYTLRARRVLPEADVLVTNTFWLPMLERRRGRGRLYVHVARYPRGQLRWYPRNAILQTVSTPILDAIRAEVPNAGSRAIVVPYPVGSAYLQPLAPESGRTLLYAGRIHPEKGLDLLVRAFLRGGDALAGWTLRLVGPWETSQGGGGAEYRRQLVALAAPAGGRVQVVDPLFDEPSLGAEYARAPVFVYPSLAEKGETFGLAVLEAMAAGGAPVVSALACFRDFVADGVNGLVFDHRASDPAQALADRLAKLVADAPRREALRRAAWSTARRYTVPEIAQQYLASFARAADPRHRE